jgi:hypothetical protein
MPIIELRRITRLKPESVYLCKFSENVTSQFGQDGVITKIFQIIGATNEWCVEFGAWDGELYSNTWNLRENHRWKAVLIEGDSSKASLLESKYGNKAGIHCIKRLVSFEGPDSLDEILATTPIPKNYDFLSIDIDGNDWHIWESVSYYRPRVVSIEINNTIPNEIYFVQDRDPAVSHGNSLLAMIELGKHKGYQLVSVIGTDAIFVLEEFFANFGIDDNSIDAMFTPGELETMIFQTYDHTFFAAGMLRVNWTDPVIVFPPDQFQVFPSKQRR